VGLQRRSRQGDMGTVQCFWAMSEGQVYYMMYGCGFRVQNSGYGGQSGATGV
jgi:hypothetical protein